MQKHNPGVVPALLTEGNSNPQLVIASTSNPVPASMKRANDYVELKKLIKQHKLLDKQPVYYTYKIISILGMLALSVTLLFTVHNFWFQMANAVLLAVASAQISFLWHRCRFLPILPTTARN